MERDQLVLCRPAIVQPLQCDLAGSKNVITPDKRRRWSPGAGGIGIGDRIVAFY